MALDMAEVRQEALVRYSFLSLAWGMIRSAAASRPAD